MKKERTVEIKNMINAVEHYRRLGFFRGRYSPAEIGAFVYGYYKHDRDPADRLFAVCLLILFLRACERSVELSLLRFVCEGIGKSRYPQKLSYWIRAFAKRHYYDERTVYRYWSYIVSLYARILSETKIKRRQ